MTDYCHSWGKSEKIVSSKEDQNTTKINGKQEKEKFGERRISTELNHLTCSVFGANYIGFEIG